MTTDDRHGVGAEHDAPTAPAAADGTGRPQPGEPRVRSALDGDVADVSVTGELTENARRPLVRTMTDLLLATAGLHRVNLDLHAVSFMNSAGMAVLVQLQRMASPRGVEVALVGPPPAVARPLQLTGLWHRFPIVEDVPGV